MHCLNIVPVEITHNLPRIGEHVVLLQGYSRPPSLHNAINIVCDYLALALEACPVPDTVVQSVTTPDKYFSVDPSDFEYFEACDDSVLLCHTNDHNLTGSGVLHQSLPARFQNVNLHTFAKFVNRQTLKPNTCFDFSDWFELLAFLGAKPKFNEKLKSLVGVSTCCHAILSAFRVANIMASTPQQAEIAVRDENADFFVAHNMEVVFSEDRDPSLKLYIPDEIVQMLDAQVMILASYKVVAKTRCKANWNILDFVTGTGSVNTLLKVCAILIRHNYIITREKNFPTRLSAIAPADSPDFDNVYMGPFRDIKCKISSFIPKVRPVERLECVRR